MIWLATVARAGTALDGSSGLWTVPTADTAPPGKLRASASLEAVRDFDGFEARGLPVGFGAGLYDRVEIGGSVDRAPAIGWQALPPVGTGVYLRARALDPGRGRPAVAVQVAGRGLGRSPVGELTGIVALEIPNGSVVVAAGPRVGRGGRAGWQGAGIEFGPRSWSVVAEQEASVGPAGLEQLEGRAGVRVALRDRAGLALWGGGGRSGGSPWAGGGIALQLASADPRGQDTDRDTILDWNERCRFEQEDIDQFEDADGCPDRDNDADGVPDFQDPTPNGEPPPSTDDLPGETGTLKMRIKPRPMPGPIHRGG